MVKKTGFRIQNSGFTVFCLICAICIICGCAFAQQPQAQAGEPRYGVNAAWVNGWAPGYWVTAGTGLSVNITPGSTDLCSGLTIFAGGPLAVAPNTTNYVFLNLAASCVPDTNTTGFGGNPKLATVVTDGAGVVTNGITDRRSIFSVASVGGGLGDPGSNGLVKRTALNTTTPAGYLDIFALFTGCSGSMIPAYDGACHTISGTGTVTDVELSMPAIFDVTGTPISSSGTFGVTLHNQSGPSWFGVPGSGPAAPTVNTTAIPAALMPAPTASTLGGINSIVQTTNSWVQYIDTAGLPHVAQPNFSNLGGTAGDAQLANAYSGVGTCTTHQWVNALARNTLPTCARPASADLSDSANLPLLNAANTFTAAQTLPLVDKGGQVYNVKAYGAKGDRIKATNGTCTASSANISVGTAIFTSTLVDAGKIITLSGCGPAGASLLTTISTVTNTTHAVMATTASTSVTGTSTFIMGTNDLAAINSAIAVCQANGGTVLFPPGHYLENATPTTITNQACNVEGTARASTLAAPNGVTGIALLKLIIQNDTANSGPHIRDLALNCNDSDPDYIAYGATGRQNTGLWMVDTLGVHTSYVPIDNCIDNVLMEASTYFLERNTFEHVTGANFTNMFHLKQDGGDPYFSFSHQAFKDIYFATYVANDAVFYLDGPVVFDLDSVSNINGNFAASGNQFLFLLNGGAGISGGYITAFPETNAGTSYAFYGMGSPSSANNTCPTNVTMNCVNSEGTILGITNMFGGSNWGYQIFAGPTTFTVQPPTPVTMSNGENNDVDPGPTGYIRVSSGPTAPFSITGVKWPAPGRPVIIENATNYPMTLKNNSTSSQAANRLYNLKPADLVLPGTYGSIATYEYDPYSALWILKSSEPHTYSGITTSLGGSYLGAGTCAGITVGIYGASAAVAAGGTITVTPNTFPGAGFDWNQAYMSSTDVADVQLCAKVGGTPTASTYNVVVTVP